MNDQEVRAGIQQSKVDETGFYFLGVEALIISGAIGYREQSWVVGIFAFLVVLILLSAMAAYEILGNFFAVVIGFAWGAVAFSLMQSNESDDGSSFAVAILVGLIGLGAHSIGFRYIRDLRRAKG